ncbi:PEP-CTERM sorting domain-containing protein [Opitutaceae bacterium TAV4]|nr:PEP-CTERM sorting domain-containing protein [Opitutaceae bacterium TAV4]RRJ99961.1 PEP-CTERM sorting domain-containing protein [Opitutaceae bacterium TAV3]
MKPTSRPSLRTLFLLACTLGLSAMLPAVLAARDLINEPFTTFDTNVWKNMAYSSSGTPGTISLDAGAGSALSLGNRGIWTKFSETPLIEDFDLSVKIAGLRSDRLFYVLITSAPDAEGKVYGYGFRWYTVAGGGTGTVRILKVNGVNPSNLNVSSSGASELGSNINSGFTYTETTPTTSTAFGAIRLTWNSSGTLSLYLGNSVTAAATVTDTSFASFTNLYISSGQSFYLDQLTLSTTSTIPEPSAWALLFGLASIGLVMLRRRIALLRH